MFEVFAKLHKNAIDNKNNRPSLYNPQNTECFTRMQSKLSTKLRCFKLTLWVVRTQLIIVYIRLNFVLN